MTIPGVSLVLPGYNEEASIEAAVRAYREILAGLTADWEIIIVDDGSTDATPALTDRLAAEAPGIRVIHNPVNLGVGISLLIGFRAATKPLVVHDAMDRPFDLEDLRGILPLFPAADVVAVVRTDRSAHSPWRRLTSWVNYRLIRTMFRLPFRDMNFVQVYKREVLRQVVVKAKSPAFVLPELLIRARDQGFRIVETRAPFHPRRAGTANYGKPRDILWTLADMLSFWLERTFGKVAG